MGWFGDFNLKRKVLAVLTAEPSIAVTLRTVTERAGVAEKDALRMLEQLCATDAVLVERRTGSALYRMNTEHATVAAVYKHLAPESTADVDGFLFHAEDDGSWTVELSDPAGLTVRGSTRQQARERAQTLQQRMAASTGHSSPS